MYRYLRLSVTPHCNLRCAYCMPEGYRPSAREEHLTEEQMLAVVRILVEVHGITKIRLTGGEPLLYRGIAGFAEQIAAIPGVTDLAVTTNGLRLAHLAQDLFNAGVTRANVSLDTLDKDAFMLLTGADGLHKVLDGIEVALGVGMTPLKINVVTIRGLNDQPAVLRRFFEYAAERPVELRFLELMPIGGKHLLDPQSFVSGKELKETIERNFGPMSYHGRSSGGTSNQFTLDFNGTPLDIGFINPVSEPFCVSCGRLRLTSEGHLVRCLRTQEHIQILPYMEEDNHDLLVRTLGEYLGPKVVTPRFTGNLPMVHIGG